MNEPLCALLVELAAREATGVARNRAAEKLARELGRWAGGYLFKRFKGHAETHGERAWTELVADASQHVLLKASTGVARFKGSSEGEAYAWCSRVLDNFVLTHLATLKRRTQRETAFEPAVVDQSGKAQADHRDDTTTLARVLEEAERVLPALVRKQDRESMETAVRCFLEARRGDSIAEQVERYGFRGRHAGADRDTKGMRQARDRVYQYRHRGAEALARALDAIGASGRFDAGDVAMTRAQLVGGRALEPPPTSSTSEMN